MNAFKDPVCGMVVHETGGFELSREGQRYLFCSESCRRAFELNPEKYTSHTSPEESSSPDLSRRIAYFSMEVAVDPRMPTYSGGLGVLAGDTLRSCADLKIPIVAVSLLYKNGYFEQHLDESGNQQEQPVVWDPADYARPLATTVEVVVDGRPVVVRAWVYEVTGIGGYRVPVYLLDANLQQNHPDDRELTSWLYGGDQRYRLAQEIILGLGGVRLLRALRYVGIERFHMNEGHAALLTLELLKESTVDDFEGVRRRCVFTTHTPVAAGHDQFAWTLVERVLGTTVLRETIRMLGGPDRLNMTLLALNMSHHVNGVAKRHGGVSREMFPGYSIDSITNGVHSRTWTCETFARLYDSYVPGWVNDPFALRNAISIPTGKVWGAHVEAKNRLIMEVERRTGRAFDAEVLTLGVARRATPYKRADLLLSDPVQLMDAARSVGPIQILFAGKAHPQDEPGKEVIRRIARLAGGFKEHVRVAYLENYDMALAQLLTSGVDLWINTPLRPLEASGTSGMKAAHNGVPSFSVLDGWWCEGHIEGVTGWSIGPKATENTDSRVASQEDAQDLYRKLQAVVLPTFYNDRDRWAEIMRQAIAFNASFFNTHRMVQQYAASAYL